MDLVRFPDTRPLAPLEKQRHDLAPIRTGPHTWPCVESASGPCCRSRPSRLPECPTSRPRSQSLSCRSIPVELGAAKSNIHMGSAESRQKTGSCSNPRSQTGVKRRTVEEASLPVARAKARAAADDAREDGAALQGHASVSEQAGFVAALQGRERVCGCQFAGPRDATHGLELVGVDGLKLRPVGTVENGEVYPGAPRTT